MDMSPGSSPSSPIEILDSPKGACPPSPIYSPPSPIYSPPSPSYSPPIPNDCPTCPGYAPCIHSVYSPTSPSTSPPCSVCGSRQRCYHEVSPSSSPVCQSPTSPSTSPPCEVCGSRQRCYHEVSPATSPSSSPVCRSHTECVHNGMAMPVLFLDPEQKFLTPKRKTVPVNKAPLRRSKRIRTLML